ncbi:hypothetical protein ACVWWK_005064 [Bradyrhizobium sp. LB9.1b]
MSNKALWRAVVQQAITDAAQPLSTKRRSARLDQIRTREWLTQPNSDFEDVCGLAELDPTKVRKHVLPLIAEAAKNDQPMPERTRQRRVRFSARHTPGASYDNTKLLGDRSIPSAQERTELEIF